MRNYTRSRGYLFTLDAILALVLVLFAVFFVFSPNAPYTAPVWLEDSTRTLTMTGALFNSSATQAYLDAVIPQSFCARFIIVTMTFDSVFVSQTCDGVGSSSVFISTHPFIYNSSLYYLRGMVWLR
jgi:hypothetical protein